MINHIPETDQTFLNEIISRNGIGKTLLAIGENLRNRAEKVRANRDFVPFAQRMERVAGRVDQVAVLRDCEGL